MQAPDVLTRLDPATGEMREYGLPSGARAHTVTAAEDGMIWYAGNGNGTIGQLDPETGGITEYPMPDPAAGDPHSAIVAPDGRVYFTVQRGNMVGRVDPATGKLQEWPSPSGTASHPYAIAWFDGAVWYNESGMRPDMLVRFDPEAEAFQSWPIPSGDIQAGIVRHMRVTRDGAGLLIHQSATNRVMRVQVRPAS